MAAVADHMSRNVTRVCIVSTAGGAAMKETQIDMVRGNAPVDAAGAH